MNRPPAKSLTGHHYLTPNQHHTYVSITPNAQRPGWTFGRGAVIWRIWPAVGVHTFFAAVIVTVSLKTNYHLGIPNVLMTIMGLILGFVISYRVSSGYDRYWWGRCYWSDLVRNCRTMGRLIWFHVPARKTPNKAEVTQDDINQVVAEKKLALDMLQGFAVAVKHHLRGEPGPYYEDLYSLVECMEENPYHTHQQPLSASSSSESIASSHIIRRANGRSPHKSPVLVEPIPNPSSVSPPRPIERWRTFQDVLPEDETRPLLPSSMPPNNRHVSYDSELIPFSSVASGFRKLWKSVRNRKKSGETPDASRFKIYKNAKGRRRPSLAGGGTNLPLDILRSLSEWLAALEDRGTVPGTSLGPMIGTMAALEDSLTGLERILTTPLPFVYSVHIRQTVWIYLFFLPFQLVDLFGWVSIPGTALAAFFFLGFLAAGEEIENPFGTDANDLDMDLWCREIINVDAAALARSASVNATFAQPTVGEATANADNYGGSIIDAARRAAAEAADDSDDEGGNSVFIKPGKKPSSSDTGTASPFLAAPAPPPSGPVATTTTIGTDLDMNQPAATMPMVPTPMVAAPLPPPPVAAPIMSAPPPAPPAPSAAE